MYLDGSAPSLAAERALTAIRELVAAAPGAGAAAWPREERESVIARLDAAVRELTVYRGEILLAHREEGSWGTALDRDFADWRARTTGEGRGPAMGELQVAEGLRAMPEVAAAVAEGDLTIEHARALSRLRATGSAEVQEALKNGVVADLVDLGRSMSAPELAKEAKKVAATIDARAAQENFTSVWRRRSVTSRRSAGGRQGEWFLDDVGGTIVDTALDAIVGTPAKDDSRTREQRRADALVVMASRVLQVGNDLTGAQVRPHLALVVEERTWRELRVWREAVEGQDSSGASGEPREPGEGGAVSRTGLPGGSAGDGGPVTGSSVSQVGCTFVDGEAGRRTGRLAGRLWDGGDVAPSGGAGVAPSGGAGVARPLRGRTAVPSLPDVPPAELEDGTIVPLAELERLMCDCEVTRLVMDARGLPMDVGQTQRTYAKELRRAVTTRDRKCQWPGCSIRASWCEVHHLWWFSKGGPTTVDHGMTVCSYHHHCIHDEHVSVTVLADGFDFHHRDGRRLGTSRRPARPPGTSGRPVGPPGASGRLGPPGAPGRDRGSRSVPDAYSPPRAFSGGPHEELLVLSDTVADQV